MGIIPMIGLKQIIRLNKKKLNDEKQHIKDHPKNSDISNFISSKTQNMTNKTNVKKKIEESQMIGITKNDEEVISRLRKLGHPSKIFGEACSDRYLRLVKIENETHREGIQL